MPDLRLDREVDRRRRAWEREEKNVYFVGVSDDVGCDFSCVYNTVLVLRGAKKGTYRDSLKRISLPPGAIKSKVCFPFYWLNMLYTEYRKQVQRIGNLFILFVRLFPKKYSEGKRITHPQIISNQIIKRLIEG